MKKLLKSRALLALTFLTLGITIGALSMKAYDKHQQSKLQPQHPFARFFGLSQDQNSPFQQLQKQLNEDNSFFGKMDEEEESLWSGLFHSRMGGNAIRAGAGKIEEREDEQFRYFELNVPDLSPDKVEIRVEEGQLEISGKIEKKTENENGTSIMSSTFHKSFPVPDDVESDKVQLEQKKDSIVIKFQKIPGK